MVEVINKTRSDIDVASVERVVESFLKVHKQSGKEVSVVFIGDKLMRRLNREYRKIDKVTDILTFEGEGDFFGEIIIDYLQIVRQSRRFSESVEEELVFILVHGLFHLLGYEDDTEKDREEMILMGRRFIEKHL